jgi:hypothetical protein
MAAKSTYSKAILRGAGYRQEGDPMPDVLTQLLKPELSIVPTEKPAISDEECLRRLARAIEDRHAENLEEVARLIARLAVTIE